MQKRKTKIFCFQLTEASTLYLAIYTSSFVHVATYLVLLSCCQVVNFGSFSLKHQLRTVVCAQEQQLAHATRCNTDVRHPREPPPG